MVKNGAALTQAEVDQVVGYLGAKSAFESRCNSCHELQRPLTAIKNPEQWRATVVRMAAMKPGVITDGEAGAISPTSVAGGQWRSGGASGISAGAAASVPQPHAGAQPKGVPAAGQRGSRPSVQEPGRAFPAFARVVRRLAVRLEPRQTGSAFEADADAAAGVRPRRGRDHEGSR
jgi:hypothetical protein